MNINLFAYTYDNGAYGACAYEAGSNTNCSTVAQSGGATTTTSGGLLTNTGFDILAAVTLACAIIFVALLVRFWKRPAKPQAS